MRLLQHPAINQASVVGVHDARYGEAIAAFLQLRPGFGPDQKPTLRQVAEWVRETLAHQKAPSHLFWVGPGEEALQQYPVTGSGKIRKEILREMGNRLREAGPTSAKL